MALHLHYQARKSDTFYTPSVVGWMRDAWPCGERPTFYSGGAGSGRGSAATVIAMHVRRYDIDNTTRLRWLSDERHLECLQRVKGRYPHADAHVFAWREQLSPAFDALATVHVGHERDTITTFDAFLHADVLISARSTLSVTAALLHTNVFVPSADGVGKRDDASLTRWAPGTFLAEMPGFALPSRWQLC